MQPCLTCSRQKINSGPSRLGKDLKTGNRNAVCFSGRYDYWLFRKGVRQFVVDIVSEAVAEGFFVQQRVQSLNCGRNSRMCSERRMQDRTVSMPLTKVGVMSPNKISHLIRPPSSTVLHLPLYRCLGQRNVHFEIYVSGSYPWELVPMDKMDKFQKTASLCHRYCISSCNLAATVYS